MGNLNNNNKNNDLSNFELIFIPLVFIALVVGAFAFGMESLDHNNGIFAIASSICLASLLYGTIKLLD